MSTDNHPLKPSPEHVLFLTGRLAEARLKAILAELAPTDFTYEIRNIGVSVAALMTAQMLPKRLKDLRNVDRIIVPGLCLGDLSHAAEALGIPCIRGPIDLKDLPAFFGHAGKPPDLSRYDVTIFAEIVDAPMLTVDAIVERARRYQRDGADIIDIGCLPDTPFPHLEETVIALKEEGFKVSVDSLLTEDLLRGGKAGADYLLSLKESTLAVMEEVAATPVLIPEQHGELHSLYRAIEHCLVKQRPFYADPILDPIHFGFTQSVIRYHQLRQRYPNVEIMMGIGNLTELTEADTTGINALLFGMISELQLNAVLATEVSPHCCSAIREADKARRLMFAARRDKSLPKGIDSSLLGIRARRPFPYSADEIELFYQQVRDPSYRVQLSAQGIHVYNRDGLFTDTDPFTLFAKLALLHEDAPHAFYMGVELAKAEIAWQLGKRYQQDQPLDWGACVTLQRAARHAPPSTLEMSQSQRRKRKKK